MIVPVAFVAPVVMLVIVLDRIVAVNVPGSVGVLVRMRLIAKVAPFTGLEVGQRRFAGPAAASRGHHAVPSISMLFKLRASPATGRISS